MEAIGKKGSHRAEDHMSKSAHVMWLLGSIALLLGGLWLPDGLIALFGAAGTLIGISNSRLGRLLYLKRMRRAKRRLAA